MIFQEILFLMLNASNPHRWPQDSLQTYWFGTLKTRKDMIPEIVPVGILCYLFPPIAFVVSVFSPVETFIYH